MSSQHSFRTHVLLAQTDHNYFQIHRFTAIATQTFPMHQAKISRNHVLRITHIDNTILQVNIVHAEKTHCYGSAIYICRIALTSAAITVPPAIVYM